jgi:prefoldin subunit 5
MTSKEQEFQPQQQGGVESKIRTKDELYEMLNKMKTEMETNHTKAIGELEKAIGELETNHTKAIGKLETNHTKAIGELETNHTKAIGELETKIAELEKSSLKQGEDISKLKDKMHSLEKGVTVRVAGRSL